MFDVTVIKGKTEPDRLSKAAIYRKYLYAYKHKLLLKLPVCSALDIFIIQQEKLNEKRQLSHQASLTQFAV